MYEIDPTTLQQWEYASRFVDTSVEAIISARKRMLSKVGESGEGVIDLGEELGSIIYTGDTADDIFWGLLDTVGNIPDALKRDEIAMQLFGRSFDTLLPLINKGRGAWEGFMEEAPTLTEDQVKALGDANDAYERLQADMEALKLSVAADFAPAFNTVTESLTGVLGIVSDWVNSEKGQEVINKFTEAVTSFLDSITEEDIENAVNALGTGMTEIMTAAEWILNNAAGVGTALVSAFAVLEGSKAFIAVKR